MKKVLRILTAKMEFAAAQRGAMQHVHKYTSMLMWDQVWKELNDAKRQVEELVEVEEVGVI